MFKRSSKASTFAFRKSICAASSGAKSRPRVAHKSLFNDAARGEQPFFGMVIKLHVLQAKDNLGQRAREHLVGFLPVSALGQPKNARQ